MTKDRIDNALEIGAGFDWITPLFSLFGGMRGRVEHFKVPFNWISFVDVTLGEAGIKICNPMTLGDEYMFDIRAEDADRAALLLGMVRR